MTSQSSFFTKKAFLRKKPDNRKSSSTPKTLSQLWKSCLRLGKTILLKQNMEKADNLVQIFRFNFLRK